MSFIGIVEHGVVKLPAKKSFPDGTRVRVEKLASFAKKHRKPPSELSLVELLGRLKGSGLKLERRKDLPRKLPI
jgi:hypothetical protein